MMACFFPSLASALSIAFNGCGPVSGETGTNAAIQWNINWKDGSTIRFIEVYIQSQSKKQLQIVYWVNLMPHFAEKTHQDRFKLNFAKNKFTLKITKTEYEDSGNYFLVVQ